MGLLDVLGLSRRAARAARAATDDELFDDEFQRKLDYLALVSRQVFAGRLRAERRTKKSGSGVEFADHRDYQPGDDFRYLDWNVYQRFERLLAAPLRGGRGPRHLLHRRRERVDGRSADGEQAPLREEGLRGARLRGPREPRPREHRLDERPA